MIRDWTVHRLVRMIKKFNELEEEAAILKRLKNKGIQKEAENRAQEIANETDKFLEQLDDRKGIIDWIDEHIELHLKTTI